MLNIEHNAHSRQSDEQVLDEARQFIAREQQAWWSNIMDQETSKMLHGDPREPPRGPLPPEILAAARTIHAKVWTDPYRPGEGPMHHAGGPYWRNELLRRADEWERLAAAARICATWLPER